MSTGLNLTSYSAVKQAAFVRMVIPMYGVLRFSSHDVPVSITEDDNVAYSYLPLGILLGISEFNNELSPSGSDVTISMSAIDQAFVANMMDYKLKGSSVIIYRVFFNATTGVALNITGNPSKRFQGVIANYSFNDEFNQFSNVATTTVSVSCSSLVKVLEQKIVGQRTNDYERKYNFPGYYCTAAIPGGTGFSFKIKTTTTGGAIASIDEIEPGTGYTNGTYTNQSFTTDAGLGTGGRITVVVTSGSVSSVTVTTAGTGYRGDDAGFARVATIANSNFDFGKPLAVA
jgi:hypothetical protein